jgi:hypothetical protein
MNPKDLEELEKDLDKVEHWTGYGIVSTILLFVFLVLSIIYGE